MTRCWPPLRIGVVMEHPGAVGNGSHFGFLASSRAQVDAFYAKALAQGAKGDGAPGHRAHYRPQYYGGLCA